MKFRFNHTEALSVIMFFPLDYIELSKDDSKNLYPAL